MFSAQRARFGGSDYTPFQCSITFNVTSTGRLKYYTCDGALIERAFGTTGTYTFSDCVDLDNPNAAPDGFLAWVPYLFPTFTYTYSSPCS